jgi:hypothetical protein
MLEGKTCSLRRAFTNNIGSQAKEIRMCYTDNMPYNRASRDFLDWKTPICGKVGLTIPILQSIAKVHLFYMAQANYMSMGRSASTYQ